MRKTPKCCGLPMSYKEVFGIRIYSCEYRGHHDQIFENLYTGEQVSEKDLETTRSDWMEDYDES